MQVGLPPMQQQQLMDNVWLDMREIQQGIVHKMVQMEYGNQLFLHVKVFFFYSLYSNSENKSRVIIFFFLLILNRDK